MQSGWRQALFRKTFLKFQQHLLGCESAAVACKRAVAAYHSVAWGEDGDGVGTVGVGYGADGLWHAYAPCHISIGNGLAIRYGQKFTPYGFLEVGAYEQQRYAECLSLLGEELVELCHRLFYHVRCAILKLRVQHTLQPPVCMVAVLLHLPVAQA